MRLLLLTLFILAACGRPLTPNEVSFARQIHGDTVDVTRIRAVQGALIGNIKSQRPKRPQVACRERIYPEPQTDLVTTAPAGFVIHNRIFLSQRWYRKDYLQDYPNRIDLADAMLFSHEIMHAWQWQNRDVTGYSPFRAAREHEGGADPYLYDIVTQTPFLEFGFEQQAAIVEEYVCCEVLDPQGARTKRLKNLLEQAFPVQRLTFIKEVDLPWPDAQTKGICS